METQPGEGVAKEDKFPNNRKPSHQKVCGEFWNLRGQHNWEEKKKKYTPNGNSQQRSCPDAHVCYQQEEAGQGGAGCMVKVRTGPECLEDNLRELT